MVKEEIWSVPLGRVRDFFLQQQDVTSLDETVFSCGSCRVTLTELPAALSGMWAAPRTLLRLEGEETDVARIYRRFFLQFLSAGG